MDVIVQHVHGGLVLDDIQAGLTGARSGAVHQPKRGAKFNNPRFECGVAGRDVVELQVGVADHVQQHKGMRGVDLVFRQVFRPSLGAQGVLGLLVLRVVEEQHHVVLQIHVWYVASEFQENGHSTRCIVGARDRKGLVAFIFILVRHVAGVVVSGKHELAVAG